MEVTVDFYREIPDCEGGFEELHYEVTCDVSPSTPARISGPVEKCHPAEGGEVEILKVVEVNTNKEVELEFSSKELGTIEDQAAEQASESDDGPEWDDDDDD